MAQIASLIIENKCFVSEYSDPDLKEGDTVPGPSGEKIPVVFFTRDQIGKIVTTNALSLLGDKKKYRECVLELIALKSKFSTIFPKGGKMAEFETKGKSSIQLTSPRNEDKLGKIKATKSQLESLSGKTFTVVHMTPAQVEWTGKTQALDLQITSIVEEISRSFILFKLFFKDFTKDIEVNSDLIIRNPADRPKIVENLRALVKRIENLVTTYLKEQITPIPKEKLQQLDESDKQLVKKVEDWKTLDEKIAMCFKCAIKCLNESIESLITIHNKPIKMPQTKAKLSEYQPRVSSSLKALFGAMQQMELETLGTFGNTLENTQALPEQFSKINTEMKTWLDELDADVAKRLEKGTTFFLTKKESIKKIIPNEHDPIRIDILQQLDGISAEFEALKGKRQQQISIINNLKELDTRFKPLLQKIAQIEKAAGAQPPTKRELPPDPNLLLRPHLKAPTPINKAGE